MQFSGYSLIYKYAQVFGIHVTVHRDKFLIIEPTRCINISKFYFGILAHLVGSIIRNVQVCFVLRTVTGTLLRLPGKFAPDITHALMCFFGTICAF